VTGGSGLPRRVATSAISLRFNPAERSPENTRTCQSPQYSHDQPLVSCQTAGCRSIVRVTIPDSHLVTGEPATFPSWLGVSHDYRPWWWVARCFALSGDQVDYQPLPGRHGNRAEFPRRKIRRRIFGRAVPMRGLRAFTLSQKHGEDDDGG